MMSSTMSIPNQPAALRDQMALSHQAVVVGIYGLPGSGKTYLLSQLREELTQGPFSFYDGSEVIDSLVSGGLSSFKEMDEENQLSWRQQAIEFIRKESVHRGHIAVVAGHYMFWPEEEETGHPVWTEEDKATYTHILYLGVPEDIIQQRCQQDTTRKRPSMSATHLHRWQLAEQAQLRKLCYAHGISFSLLSPQENLVKKVSAFLHDFQHHNEEHNLALARAKLDQILAAGSGNLETMLVLDGDKTLAAEDTGALFWNMISNTRLESEESPLKAVFSKGYSYTSFRQAMLLYEETMNDEEFNTMCQNVASAVKVHPEFQALLHRTRVHQHVSAVIITCGLRRIWEIVLASYGLSDTVKVIGSGRLADGFVITPTVKGALVSHLQDNYRLFVWVFGDSPLDLIMLSKADQAIVVVGDERTRSKSMEIELAKAIAKGEIRARQTLLPSIAAPRLDTVRLPLVHLTDARFIDSVFTRRERLQLIDATNRGAAKLLMTPMRNAMLSGPVLRKAHQQVGWYLGVEFLTDVIGVEKYEIPHVQGHKTEGHQLLHAKETLIVALMRGGEPMALGVSRAIPLAMFLHAKNPEDVKAEHVNGKLTVCLVDSVVNSGGTVAEFVEHIRKFSDSIRVVVIAGVVQAGALAKDGPVRALAHQNRLTIVTLRLSDNKFTGRGATDTGNRLYNTVSI